MTTPCLRSESGIQSCLSVSLGEWLLQRLLWPRTPPELEDSKNSIWGFLKHCWPCFLCLHPQLLAWLKKSDSILRCLKRATRKVVTKWDIFVPNPFSMFKWISHEKTRTHRIPCVPLSLFYKSIEASAKHQIHFGKCRRTWANPPRNSHVIRSR